MALRYLGGGLALLAALAIGACSNPGSPLAALGSPSPSPLPSPPWPVPSDVAGHITAAGLTPLPAEGTAFHVHAHLDVFLNGQSVPVAARIGIAPDGTYISPLHTHDTTGLLHIESPSIVSLTIGQFFTEWGVPLAGAKGYVAGQAVSDVSSIVLADHEEIAVVYGTPPSTIPSGYAGAWPNSTSPMPGYPGYVTPSPTPTASPAASPSP